MTPVRRNVALGILRLARGRADGLAQFEGTPRAVVSALTPLAAMMLVALAAVLTDGTPPVLRGYLVAGAVALLAQLVLSYELARRWGRAAEWYRFAAAFCWCQWAAPLATMALIVVTSLMLAAGFPEDATALVGLVGLLGYALWLHWFLACHALELSRGRALLMVLLVNAGTMVLVSLPQLAAPGG